MKKRFGLLVLSLMLTCLLAACGQPRPVTTEATMNNLVKSYESYLNAGDIQGAAALFETGSYISVVNRIDADKGVIDENVWTIFIDIPGWLETRSKESYHLTLSDCEVKGVRVVCQSKIDINGHTVDGTQETTIQDNKITAISIVNSSIE